MFTGTVLADSEWVRHYASLRYAKKRTRPSAARKHPPAPLSCGRERPTDAPVLRTLPTPPGRRLGVRERLLGSAWANRLPRQGWGSSVARKDRHEVRSQSGDGRAHEGGVTEQFLRAASHHCAERIRPGGEELF